MIPRLKSPHNTEQRYLDYLSQLQSAGFTGDICPDFSDRIVQATDNSAYQVLPQAVVFPANAQDIQAIFKLANQAKHQNICFSPRGGGTGTNGQSLTSGIIVDVSRHMNQILELNLEQGWVTVEPGVVLDQLNAYLKPHGVFFAPDLSPSNRATLGGMVNTDACGKGSRIYGRTSDHVLEVSSILVDGKSWVSKEIELDQLELVRGRDDIIGIIHRQVDDICRNKRDLIQQTFPRMSRFLTGYNLEHVYNDSLDKFNLNYLLAGSEGTLALVSQLKLKLTPIPASKQLVAIKYDNFDTALRAAQILVQSNPAAIETIDGKIIGLAREDEIWHRVENMVGDQDDKQVKAVNLVEFVGDDPLALQQQMDQLCHTLDSLQNQPGQAFGYHRTTDSEEIASLWQLRKKGVGLLGNAKGERRPMSGVEDTAVPPEHLADYIADFRALLEKHGLEYGMFGHVDVGCLHVRPAFDLRNESDETLYKTISDEVCKLVQKYGGVMWGEHGKGFRAEYSPEFFGEELFNDLRKIKAAFDPDNQLNPGKICTAGRCDHRPEKAPANVVELVTVDGPTRGQQDRQIPLKTRQSFDKTIHCNGNSACFNYDEHDPMCPSWKLTRDRRHSPKGRAGLMREWLRQMANEGTDTLILEKRIEQQNWFDFIRHYPKRINNSLIKKQNDYAHEINQSMQHCLACKACASQCPVKVDVPEFRSRFFQMYYSRYLRPARDYLIAGLEPLAKIMGMAPKFANKISQAKLVEQAMRKLGLIRLPLVSEQTVMQGLIERRAEVFSHQRLSRMNDEEKANCILLIQDPYTSWYDAEVVLASYDLLSALGYRVLVPSLLSNGKALHVRGFLKAFKKQAKTTVKELEKLARHNLPMVGVDPAATLVFRQEYKEVTGEQQNYQVLLLQEYLASQIGQFKDQFQGDKKYVLMGHCTEKTSIQTSAKMWQSVFEAAGLTLVTESSGCCGMAGVYGHEAAHEQDSTNLYHQSWGKKIRLYRPEQVLATGYSCRSQVKYQDGFKPLHPVQALLAARKS
ncbi:D-2-hydroxyglutarate dehydrogenase YdiJ [Pelagibaculum spongiae]|uniref:D-2-hydroxyglutarate dehydrogenase n=1 Tax=Pelagibaculum spongiae TaxID=2080658 RepID=A0A2V1H517_9GAMM|nr:FAD-binding and (Fe-S)-binding domain-containing protein [Pelagibaculum spongiae]PVZ72297.1 glycerol-3-phosphate dehydrogenase [Pelagibaculum spongiae]